MSTADQVRAMGLVVGDTIVGRETYQMNRWSEAELTIKFIGREVVVFDTRRRDWDGLEWRDDDESADWTLECRDWKKVAP